MTINNLDNLIKGLQILKKYQNENQKNQQAFWIDVKERSIEINADNRVTEAENQQLKEWGFKVKHNSITFSENEFTNILKCPFCGGKCYVEETYITDTSICPDFRVVCSDDYNHSLIQSFDTPEEAIEAWNKRI